ncbi:MAG: PEP-CTERM sorting domain-containing protein [Cyanobacteria bacterium SID2]|nr:PEP-CTERM sorting domain-containing protein [Cyanobacteria bacterium SID2]
MQFLKDVAAYATPPIAATLALSASISPASAGSLLPGETFGTDGIYFLEDTTVTFNFDQTHGKYRSELKIFQVDGDTLNFEKLLFEEVKAYDDAPNQVLGEANGWVGSCGNTVLTCEASFTFLANVEYTLGLVSVPGGTVYSTTDLNPTNTQQAVFGSRGSIASFDGTLFPNPEDFTSIDPFADLPIELGFDDRGNGNDMDFQDMTLFAQARRSSAAVPEPSVTLGLLSVSVLVGLRLRRHRSV